MKKEGAMARVQEPMSEVNGNLSDILRRADAYLQSQPKATAQFDGSSQVSSMIRRVCGTSVAEIDGLIGELRSLRDYLLKEGVRIQRELTEYTRLSQGALDSTKIIAETLMRMKTGPDSAPRTQ
jgi:hypothetical protein